MDDSRLARAAAATFLEQNRDVTAGLVEFLNKAQRVNSLTIAACTGKAFDVHEILTDRVIKAVSQRGPDVIIQILEVIDNQMDQALGALEAAFAAAEAAAATEAQALAPASPETPPAAEEEEPTPQGDAAVDVMLEAQDD